MKHLNLNDTGKFPAGEIVAMDDSGTVRISVQAKQDAMVQTIIVPEELLSALAIGINEIDFRL